MLEIPQEDDSLFRLVIALGTISINEREVSDAINIKMELVNKQPQTTAKTKESIAELKKLMTTSTLTA